MHRPSPLLAEIRQQNVILLRVLNGVAMEGEKGRTQWPHAPPRFVVRREVALLPVGRRIALPRNHATVKGIHAALIESYEADGDIIDPRLLFEVTDPDKCRKLNAAAPHSRQMRRTAQRLRDGEILTVEATPVQRLLGAAASAWLADTNPHRRRG